MITILPLTCWQIVILTLSWFPLLILFSWVWSLDKNTDTCQFFFLMLHFVNCFNWTSSRGWVTCCTSWLWCLLYRISLLRRGSLWKIFQVITLGLGGREGNWVWRARLRGRAGNWVWEGAWGKMGRGKGHHFPRAAAFPSPQSYCQETFTVKAARKRPRRRREVSNAKCPTIGYWPKLSSRWLGINQDLFYLLMDWGAGEVHKYATKGLYQYPAILTKQGLVWKVLIIIMTNRAPVINKIF